MINQTVRCLSSLKRSSGLAHSLLLFSWKFGVHHFVTIYWANKFLCWLQDHYCSPLQTTSHMLHVVLLQILSEFSVYMIKTDILDCTSQLNMIRTLFLLLLSLRIFKWASPKKSQLNSITAHKNLMCRLKHVQVVRNDCNELLLAFFMTFTHVTSLVACYPILIHVFIFKIKTPYQLT